MLRCISIDTIFTWEHLRCLVEICRGIIKVVGLENVLAGAFLFCYMLACLLIAAVLRWMAFPTTNDTVATEWTVVQLWSMRLLVVFPAAALALLIRYFSKSAADLVNWVFERITAACQGLRFIRSEGRIRLGASELFWFILAAMYALSPLDLVPDILPVFGWLDDFGFLYWAGGQAFAFAMRCAEARGRASIDSSGSPGVGFGASTATEVGADCNICLNQKEQAAIRPCGHRFCRGCAENIKNRGFSCPLCRASISGIHVD
mmetsp:Transcript_56087/g.108229  ORF Transcript_56087/g.108229 Transcript_56087/m.108229 type:complete len:261 (+) Transcript_56087:69-851(+)